MENLEIAEGAEAQAEVGVIGPSRLERFRSRIRGMSNTERSFCFATFALSILAAILLWVIITYSTNGRPTDGAGGVQYCLTKECIRSAAQIMNSMNSSVDPCVDFYEFACGGWRKIPGDEDNWTLRLVREALTKTADLLSTHTRSKAVQKAQWIYDTCMATGTLDKFGLEPLLDILERAGLPRGIPSAKTAVDFDLTRTIARVQRTIGKAVLLDVLRSSNETFSVWMPTIDLHQTPNIAVLEMIDTYIRNASRDRIDLVTSNSFRSDWQEFVESFNHMVEDLETLKSKRFMDRSAFDRNDFVTPKLKWKLFQAPMVNSLLYNGTIPNNKTNTLYYDVYMETLLEGRPEVNWTVKTGSLRLADPEYHMYLAQALQKFSPVKIQMLIWSEVVKHFGVHTTTEFRQKMLTRKEAMRSQQSRSDACANLVIKLMPIVVEHLFAQVEPLTEITKQVESMTKVIKSSQRELVEKATWLDPLGQRNILRHLDEISLASVGYIDWVTTGSKLDEFFQDITINNKGLLQTMADIQVWQTRDHAIVSPKVGRLKSAPVLAGAYYIRSVNTVTVRPITMRPPFYPLGLDALNYGAMGLVLGHEFGHAVDSEGFASENYFFLEDPSIKRVNDFVSCTKDSVRWLTVLAGVKADPDVSINEDMSDISGLQTALYAFNKIRKGSEPHLPGLKHFTHDQLFFLSMANIWCTNDKPPGPESEGGPHNANRLRIHNVASNSPEFAKVWKCRDSTMTPKDKCVLW